MKLVSIILANDLRRRLRSPFAVVIMMLMPLVLTLIVGIVFGRSGSVELPKIRVLLVDRDSGFMSNLLRQGLQQDRFAEMIDLVIVDGEEGYSMMREGKASALVEVPENFTGDVLDRHPTVIRVVKNPAESFLPMIVEEVVETMVLTIDRGSRIFAEPIKSVRVLLEGDRWPTGGDIEDVLNTSRTRAILVRGYLSDSLVTLETETLAPEGERTGGINLFAFVLPGSLMLGLMFISEIVLRDIVREKQTGTLARLFTTPVEAGEIIAGKIISTFLITAIACILLLVIGRFGFKIMIKDYLALALHLVASVFMCTGVITFFYGFIRSERAADAILSVAIVVMGLFGGSMVPLEQMSGTLQAAGRFSPVYWAIDGFKKILVFDAGLADIRLNLVVLLVIAVMTTATGAFMLRGRMQRGG